MGVQTNIRIWTKRTLDVCASVLALVLLAPIMAICATLILLRMGRPVLFCQIRPGLRGKPFQMLKFRTMTDDRDEDGKQLPDGERLTGLGRFLRSTSLDELPELFNVLRGEMSLVGPRPLLMAYLERYTPEQARRHEVKPGITGWAQINGRNAISWDKKFELDIWYVENGSLWLDILILARTAKKVILRDGISADAHATMPEFLGVLSDKIDSRSPQ